MLRSDLAASIRGFGERRVLVLGDMMADEYLVGRPARISREAPVLILDQVESFVRPGGATNTAYNLSLLGARVGVVGVVGDDEMGRRLRLALDEAGIDTANLFVDAARPTSTKTRIVGKGAQQVQQQIVRIDRVDASPIAGILRGRMIDSVCASLASIDALLIADYENGVISPELIETCLPEARRREIAVVVDSHGDLFRFRDVTAATPNLPEAAATLRMDIENDEDLDLAGSRLLEGMTARAVLITRGSEGVALYERGRPPYKLPVSVTGRSDAVDPNGAGDTVAAVFTLAITSGASMRQAAFLGNVAGGEAVRRFGAAALTQTELGEALHATHLGPPEE
jgi:rfaE bifunctional protein kinase chain/domain